MPIGVVANCILHEPADALLKAKPPTLAEDHKLKDGTILSDTDSKPLTERDRPSSAGSCAFRTGLSGLGAAAEPYAGARPA